MAIESINLATGNLSAVSIPLPQKPPAKKSPPPPVFRDYQRVPHDHRALWMRKLASILESEAADLALTITAEMGMPLRTAQKEVLKCAATCRYYAENAARILAPEAVPTEAGRGFVRWDPLGVILAVMPWNFPFWQVFRFLAPALMAGNVAVLKHASNVPQCALPHRITRPPCRLPRCGSRFQVLLIENRQVEGVLADERIAAVTVTGSEPAGRAIAAQAGWLIKKSVLELGGSDPFIVMLLHDLDSVAETAVRARCTNSGQSCIAAKRFIIHSEVYDAFEARFVEGMKQVRVGDPMLEDTDIGPLATARIAADLETQVKTALRDGARILTGGERIPGEGNYFSPTVLAGIPRTSPVYREELFGPVAMLFRVHDLQGAIALANDTPFGLAASAWTRDPGEQQHLVSGLEVGSVFLNGMVHSDPRLPFGGVKRSGYGRELSAAGMREFLNAKTIVIA